jgi:hypothetical protein
MCPFETLFALIKTIAKCITFDPKPYYNVTIVLGNIFLSLYKLQASSLELYKLQWLIGLLHINNVGYCPMNV